MGHRAVRLAAHDDVEELVLGDQAALGVDVELERGAVRAGRRIQRAGGHFHVLFADRLQHVAGGQAARGELLRVQPDAHAVFAGTEGLHVADAVEACQLVLDMQARIVRQVQHVVALVGRDQVHDHGQVGRALLGGHAKSLHFLRQLRQGLGDAVLHLHLGVVEVGAQREGDGQGHRAVAGGLRGGIEHAFHAVDLLLERRGDGFGDDLRVGARIAGAHDHGRRHDFGIFADRQLEQRDAAGDHDQYR